MILLIIWEIIFHRKILNDLSSDSPVKVEPFDNNNTDSSEGNDDTGSNEVDEVSGGVPGQVSSNDGMAIQGMQAIQLPTNGQSQPATVVQFNGQVYPICLFLYIHSLPIDSEGISLLNLALTIVYLLIVCYCCQIYCSILHNFQHLQLWMFLMSIHMYL